MNAVLMAVVVMVGLSLSRIHVVLSLIVGAMVGGILAGLPLDETLNAFSEGVKGGASIALSYAILGAFAMAIAHLGVPQLIADKVIVKVRDGNGGRLKWLILLSLALMAMASQNIIPIHIAFIMLIIPPLLLVFNRMQLDRRAVACVLTFGLVNTYMFIPYGFGDIFLNQIILKNVNQAGVSTDGLSLFSVMSIPALGMLCGLLVALFFSYRKPRSYQNLENDKINHVAGQTPMTTTQKKSVAVSVLAVVLAFVVQLWTGSLLLGSMMGFAIFMITGMLKWHEADMVFNDGIKMMAMIGFIMITAQGFAEVMRATGEIGSLVDTAVAIFGDNQALAIFVMLIVGLVVTLGIGSSFSTVPILAAIYVPLCMQMGLSPAATVALVAVSGVLGDAGSPASDSTLGPTMGLNADGQHDHIKDTVVPTFIHYNIPLIIFGWIAAMML